MGDEGALCDLATGTKLGGRPTMYRGLELRYFGPCTFARSHAVQRCATCRRETDAEGNAILVDIDPLLLVATATPEGLREARLVARPGREMGSDQRIFATSDSRHVVLVTAEGFVIVPLADDAATRTVRLRQVIHGMDVDAELDLIAVGLFDGVAFYRLSDGEHLGTRTLGGGNVLAAALGGGHAAVVDESRRLRVLVVARQRAPRDWAEGFGGAVRAGRHLSPAELDLSADGAFVALRHKRKEVLAVHLPSGRQQRLTGHTDRVCFVRFVDDGQRLLTADKDNRVIGWPRAGDRLVTLRRDA
jgi:hypothetical protein